MGKPGSKILWAVCAVAGLLLSCGEQDASVFETRTAALKPTSPSVTSVIVEVAQVDAVYADGSVVTLSTELASYDLLELGAGVATLVTTTDLPAGTLTEIDLAVASGHVETDQGDYPLSVQKDEIRIKVDDLAIAEGCSTEITVAFDSSKSIKYHHKHGYTLRPVLQASNFATACPPPPEPESFPLNIQYLWTNTTFMPGVAHMVGVIGTDSVGFALATTIGPTSVKRAAVTETGLAGTWSYDAESYFLDIHSGAYDPINDRFGWGGVWPDGRNARVFEANTGIFEWSSVSYGFGSATEVVVTVFDDQGRLWTSRNGSAANAIQLVDVDGTALAQLGTTLADNPRYGLGVATNDGTGDVIMSSISIMRRLHYDGTNIVEVWSQSVACDDDNASGGPFLVANGQLHHGTNAASGKIQHRDLATGELIGETDYAAVRKSAQNAVKDLVVDEYGHYWGLGSTATALSTTWDLVRYDQDWNVVSNITVEDPAHPLVNAFTSVSHRPSSVFVTSSGYVVLSGYANAASGKTFHVAAGKLVE